MAAEGRGAVESPAQRPRPRSRVGELALGALGWRRSVLAYRGGRRGGLCARGGGFGSLAARGGHLRRSPQRHRHGDRRRDFRQRGDRAAACWLVCEFRGLPRRRGSGARIPPRCAALQDSLLANRCGLGGCGPACGDAAGCERRAAAAGCRDRGCGRGDRDERRRGDPGRRRRRVHPLRGALCPGAAGLDPHPRLRRDAVGCAFGRRGRPVDCGDRPVRRAPVPPRARTRRQRRQHRIFPALIRHRASPKVGPCNPDGERPGVDDPRRRSRAGGAGGGSAAADYHRSPRSAPARRRLGALDDLRTRGARLLLPLQPQRRFLIGGGGALRRSRRAALGHRGGHRRLCDPDSQP